MALTKEDKVWLVKLATVMMNHIAWLVARGSEAQNDWTGGSSMQSWKEEVRDLTRG